TPGFSSTLSLAMVTLPCISVAISSSAGPIILQGPHHSAQKSTTTGPLDPTTSDLKLASVTLTVDMAISREILARGLARDCRQGKKAEGLRQATRHQTGRLRVTRRRDPGGRGPRAPLPNPR